MRRFVCAAIGGLGIIATGAGQDAFSLPGESRQLILGLAKDWNSSHVSLQRWSRSAGGAWKREGMPWPGRLGAKGLAWGVGIHPAAMPGLSKAEGDDRAPAGVFDLGGAFGYGPDVARRPGMPYRQITPFDLWVEDSDSAFYNRHLRIDHEPRNEWEKKQQMRLNDPAHSLKLFIEHNAPPNAMPGRGSAIFFHIWRKDGALPTSGCTTMAEPKLRDLIQWVDPGARPLFVLLPQADYARLKDGWKLP